MTLRFVISLAKICFFKLSKHAFNIIPAEFPPASNILVPNLWYAAEAADRNGKFMCLVTKGETLATQEGGKEYKNYAPIDNGCAADGIDGEDNAFILFDLDEPLFNLTFPFSNASEQMVEDIVFASSSSNTSGSLESFNN